ncbi:hypothetical protein Rhe02_78530 [Rhizocola hellebori]|uniref:NB-ARC domain-containing protein n=1 Tax=Rhizocola hellebori TaxID=1392758 RepID=A0A8J3QID1_9ACTN|nr:hypothetical protein Rhe02_78530 [Rhizocola hellebori]
MDSYLATGSGEVRIAVVFGMGGVGKTSLATEFVYRRQSDLSCAWQVDAHSRESLIQSLAQLASRLGIDEADHHTAATLALVELAHRERWILIYDDASWPADVVDLLPARGSGSIIITSRNPNWHTIAPSIELLPFPADDAVRFLVSSSYDSSDAVSALDVAMRVGHLPLALELIAAYCRTRHVDLESYAAFDQGQKRGAVESAVYRVLLRSFRSLCWRDPVAADLLRLMAFFAENAIPRRLITEYPQLLPVSLRKCSKDPLMLNGAYASLFELSLIRQDTKVSVHIHGLVQAALRQVIEDGTRSWSRRLVSLVKDRFQPLGFWRFETAAGWRPERWHRCATELLAAAFPLADSGSAHWDACAELLPHALVVLSEPTTNRSPIARIDLLFAVGRYLHDRGEYQRAVSCLEECLRIRLATHVDSRVEITRLETNLAMALRAMGRTDQAVDLHGASLRRSALEHGDQDPNTLYASVKLAMALRTRAETRLSAMHQHLSRLVPPAEADLLEPLLNDLRASRTLRSARKIVEILSNRDRDISTSFLEANGAELLQVVDSLETDLLTARSLQENALVGYRGLYGDDHAETLYAANNLSTTMRTIGDMDDAHKLATEVMQRYVRLMGQDHPDTLKARNNLALIVRAMGDLNAAKDLLTYNYECRQRVLGDLHPDTLRSANNVAATLVALGDHSSALSLHQSTLQALTRVLGPNHPDTMISRSTVESLRRSLESGAPG